MRLEHGRIALELHELTHRAGPSLLLLHALYGSSTDWGEAPAAWPGPVYALDFSGHGQSDWVVGGGYCPELLAADADVALAHLGRAAVAGAGLGAYVALLLAGARPDTVPAALLLAGAGLDGAGPVPLYDRDLPVERTESEQAQSAHDPLVWVTELTVRPVDYAASFAQRARRLLVAENGTARPPWWEALRHHPNCELVNDDVRNALQRLAGNNR